MKKGFTRLQIGGLTVGAASAALGGVAQGATFTLGVNATVATGGVQYTMQNTASCVTSPQVVTAGFGITSAFQTGPPSLTFPWNDALCLEVNGVDFTDADGFVKYVGTKMKAKDAVTHPSLKVKVQYFFSPTEELVRALYTFKNTHPLNTQSVNVKLDSFISNPVDVIETESGDAAIANAGSTDSWFVEETSTPFFQTWGRGDGWTKIKYPDDADNEYAEARTITLGPAERKRLVMFVRLDYSASSAINSADDFNDGSTIPASLLEQYSDVAQAETLNYSFP